MNTSAHPIPQEDRPEEPKKVIRLAKRQQGGGILSLASNRWHVREDANLLDLADDLAAYPAIPAVAVTDENGRLLGQIIRNDLLDLLGRPFGRDVLQKETVVRVARNTKSFRQDEPVLKVAAEVGRERLDDGSAHYPLKNARGEFAGSFSIQDLLIHLAGQFQEGSGQGAVFQQRILKEMQILEDPRHDIMAATFRAPGDGAEFCHLRQYDQDAWHLSLCSPSAAGQDAGLVVSLLWGVANSFDLHKGLLYYVRHLNSLVHRTFAPETGLRGLFLDYQGASGSVMLCDHGNGAAFIVRGAKVLRLKTAGNPTPLGLGTQLSTEIFKYQLLAGDRLFVLGRAIIGQTDPSGETYGPARVKQLLEKHPDASARELRQLVLADLKAFRGSVPQAGDASLVILHRK
jgi:sigma-B regulation protein RsbU (phosphoserine phosphatase)